MSHKKLFLLDAMALVFRAYYALIRNPRITSKGKNTNAQFGFTNTLIDLINNQHPTHMAVCFDTEAPTERHTDFEAYKANRQEAPEDLILAIPDIKRIIRAFNIPVVEIEGYEADDVIGTLSLQAAAAGYDVYMVTPDKDYGQLVNGNIKIYKPGYQGGEAEILGAKEVCAKWNIKDVSQVVDMLGLMGDAVDNIPGIPGVGEKTAAKLLAEYGTLENVLANADHIKGALGEKVRNGKELALMSKKLATIITNAPVEFHEEDFKLKAWNKEALREVFAELEFKTLGRRILGEEIGTDGNAVQTSLFGNAHGNQPAPADKASDDNDASEDFHTAHKNIHNTPHHYEVVEPDHIPALLQQLKKHDEICFDTETTGLDANDCELVGMSFAVVPHKAWYIPCPPEREATENILHQLKPLFENRDIQWIGHNIKFDLLVLKWYNIEVKGGIKTGKVKNKKRIKKERI